MKKRSILLDGTVTSISMEESFWDELDRVARKRGDGWAVVVREWLASAPPAENRSASIKEIILRMLSSQIVTLQSRLAEFPASWQIRLVNSRIPHLVVTSGQTLIVGRESPAQIVIEDDEVSRRHAMLVNDGIQWWVLDLKSKNGTVMRGKKIQAAELNSGSEFAVGQSRIKLMKSAQI